MAGVKDDRCAPTPNCCSRGGNLRGEGGSTEPSRQSIKRRIDFWEGEIDRDELKDIRKEWGQLDGSTMAQANCNKLEQLGRFDSTSSTNNIFYNGTDTVRKLVEQWETSGKESGTAEGTRKLFCFGQTLEADLVVGSPLKKRRMHSPSSSAPPPPPSPWTRAPGTPTMRRTCSSPSTRSPGASWGRRRPLSTTSSSRRVPPPPSNSQMFDKPANILANKHGIGGRWPSLGRTRTSTGASSSSISRGRQLDGSTSSWDQTSAVLYCHEPPERNETGSICTSLASAGQGAHRDGREDPGGGHRQPEQDGSSSLLFRCSTNHHHRQETSGNKKELEISDRKSEIITYLERNTEAKRINTVEEKKAAKEATKKKEDEAKGRKQEESGKYHHLHQKCQEDKELGEPYLLVREPDTELGQPRTSLDPWSGTAASPPKSSLSCDRGCPVTTWGAGGTGGLQDIGAARGEHNIASLYCNGMCKRAADVSGISVPRDGSKTTCGVALVSFLTNQKQTSLVISDLSKGLDTPTTTSLGNIEHQENIPT